MLNVLSALLFSCVRSVSPPSGDFPLIELTHDNTEIVAPCRIHIAPGLVIEDTDHNGVIHIMRPGVEVVFEPGSVLRGCAPGTPPDTMTGCGITIDWLTNAATVSRPAYTVLRNASISGFKRGIEINHTNYIELDNCSFFDNFRNHLGSTPAAEDSADWLWPHDNLSDKWVNYYGAAIHAVDCWDMVIHDCTVRSGQNGIILDQVVDTQIYDNDCSFLSGWGLAMWRSRRCQIQRNAFDFCIRGYSHGVYNRGQDSAGILYFEQCTNNIFAFNSVTHGGDGFFAFSGKGALGESPDPRPPGYTRAGNTDTLLYDNDFSYAAAHGVETTFSFDFRIIENRFADNAICGIWGGYSQSMTIFRNFFGGNGAAGYGLERGGVNIEHGSDNLIAENNFESNSCGVHLWSDDDPGIAKTPWYQANHKGSTDNAIVRNHFFGDQIGIQQRASSRTQLVANDFEAVDKPVVNDAWSPTTNEDLAAAHKRSLPERPTMLLGKKTPVGARPELRGRENIIMGQWGPWDHASPMIRLASHTNAGDTYEVYGLPESPSVEVISGGGQVALATVPPADRDQNGTNAKAPWIIKALPDIGVCSYTIKVHGDGVNQPLDQTLSGTIIAASWDVRVFPWTVDPRNDLEGWRKESKSPAARTAITDNLSLRYANAGPASLKSIPEFADFKGNDHFGTIASTTLKLPAGEWTISTLSDDGIHVTIDGKPVIDNWAYHGPTRDTGTFMTDAPREVHIQVEHFEIDGYATLEFAIAPANIVPNDHAK